ncbi:hypothetical protein [Eubacterium sp.]|uniref:hypothetical protein n=1 Tax=Eubacterium sp. TaxID=142586 RepID=UPI002A7F4997|nr:hypothetical protein [Eubacterium sp.]MDY3812150.1 hypothetical protein [Eubacterium sp.]
MAEYAFNGKGNLGVTLGSIGTGLSVLNGALGNLGIGGYNANDLANNGVLNLMIENATLKSDKYTDSKISDIFERLQGAVLNLERQVSANQAAQGVVNAQVGANIAVAQNDISNIQTELNGLTKTIIPITNICPEPMKQYNSWTAPTTTTTAG